jgi:hypothetical protein
MASMTRLALGTHPHTCPSTPSGILTQHILMSSMGASDAEPRKGTTNLGYTQEWKLTDFFKTKSQNCKCPGRPSGQMLYCTLPHCSTPVALARKGTHPSPSHACHCRNVLIAGNFCLYGVKVYLLHMVMVPFGVYSVSHYGF